MGMTALSDAPMSPVLLCRIHLGNDCLWALSLLEKLPTLSRVLAETSTVEGKQRSQSLGEGEVGADPLYLTLCIY